MDPFLTGVFPFMFLEMMPLFVLFAAARELAREDLILVKLDRGSIDLVFSCSGVRGHVMSLESRGSGESATALLEPFAHVRLLALVDFPQMSE